MIGVKTYDPDCYELAKSFLEDEPELNNAETRHTLAIAIQDAIEDEIAFMREHKQEFLR